MTDTPQPETAGETEVSTADAIEAAANAFKTFSYDAPEEPEVLRDEKGRFKSAQEIEAEAEAQEGEVEAESHDEEIADEAAEEAQPEPVDLPTSWPAEHGEMWNTLPAEAQAFIRQRDAEQAAAVNAKFQEAANVRKANEAVIHEANTNRQKFIEATQLALVAVQPRPEPPLSMLDQRSADYNPDAYNLEMAYRNREVAYVEGLQSQLAEAQAQQERESAQAEQAYIAQVEEKYRPALLKDVPELSDPAKQPAVLNELIQYAIKSGVGEHVFTDPEIAGRITSPELHLAWKAMQYDKMKAAQGKVQPKAPKPAAPPVRPGVATPRSAIQATERKKAFERLDREGSVEAAAAIFKLQSQGKL